MIRIAFVRGSYLNQFEGQNYILNEQRFQLVGISSKHPIHKKLPFLTIALSSIADFRGFPFLKAITNRTLGDAQILFGLEKLRNKFDIFHTADPHYYYSYQLAKMRRRNLIRSLVVTSWETIPFNNETVTRKKFIKRFTLKHADLFLCYSEKAKMALVKEGIDEDKIEIVRLGVNLNKFKNEKSKIKDKKNEIVILFVGRLVEEKGIMDLYEAFRIIQNSKLKVQNYNLKLKIIGDGFLRNILDKLIGNDGLQSSISIEQKEYKNMPKVYQEADIFVLPSKTSKTWEEQYGMVLVEAMASGLPIIASQTGAIPEVVGDCGYLVEKGDVAGMTKQLINLINDAKLRGKIGRMGRVRAEKYFDRKKTAKKIEKIYENISSSINKK